MSTEEIDRSHWSAYWLSTRSLNSFEGGNQAGQYVGPVQLFWQQQLALCGSKPLLLDVGTGNGALAFLAAEYFSKAVNDASIVAIDAADIAPIHAIVNDQELIALSEKIQFRPRTTMESLPLSDGTVDLAMSQFGFEYAQQAAAIKEIFRVLKSDGRCVFVVHDKSSTIIKESLVGLDVLTHSLERSLLFSAAKKLLLAMETQATETVKDLDRQFKSIAQDLMSRFSSSESRSWFAPLLKSLVDILNQASLGRHQLAISLFEQNLTSQRCGLLRLREQVGVAFDNEKTEQLIQFCSTESIQMEMEMLSFDGQVFGRALFLCRER